MAGISVVDQDGREHTSVSTKGYEDRELEAFELMVEDLLVQAHKSGLNISHQAGDMFIGAIWTSKEREHIARAASMNSFGQPTGKAPEVLPPAKIDQHYRPVGEGLHNPVLRHGVARYLTEAQELREQEDNDRVVFYSEDDRYPSLIICFVKED